jgi:hypothetical protein
MLPQRNNAAVCAPVALAIAAGIPPCRWRGIHDRNGAVIKPPDDGWLCSSCLRTECP